MEYRAIFKRLKNLIASPTKEWEAIAQETIERKEAAMHPIHQFVLPFIGLASAWVFFKATPTGFDLRTSVTCAGIVYASLYFGLLLSIFICEKYIYPYFSLNKSSLSAMQIIAYPYALVSLAIILAVFTTHYWVIACITLIAIYPILRCATKVLAFRELEKSNFFTLYCALLCVASPNIIFILLYQILHRTAL